MRITLLTNRDLASNYALNLLLPALSGSHSLQVLCSSTVGKAPTHPQLATLRFFEQTLPNNLLFPLIDQQRTQGELLTFAGLERYLTAPIRPLNDPNSSEGLKILGATAPELIVSIRYGCILHLEALSIPQLGTLNLHSGRLPAYRGVMATFRAMLAEDEELCSTLHWIDDDTIDTGRIISVQRHPRDRRHCYLANTLSLYPSGCEALIQTVDLLEQRQDLPHVQTNELGDYHSFPDQASIDQFNQAGHLWAEPDFLASFCARFMPHAI